MAVTGARETKEGGDAEDPLRSVRGMPERRVLLSALTFLAQAQAGWLQHDFGHLSVFSTSTWNHLLHHFVIGHLKVNGMGRGSRNSGR